MAGEVQEMITGHSSFEKIYCVTDSSDMKAIQLSSFPTPSSVFVSFDWKFALSIGLFYIIIRRLHLGRTPQKQFVNFCWYLMAVVVWRCFWPSFKGLVNPSESIWMTIVRSYQAFVAVHPMSSPLIGLCHVATIWFEVAALFSPNLQTMVLWCLLLELVASAINEGAHHLEVDLALRCVRASFVSEMNSYPVNDMIRQYIMPSFMVYGYWFPKFLLFKMFGWQ